MSRRHLALGLCVVLLLVAVGWVVVPRSPAGPPRGATLALAPVPDVSVVTVPVELLLSDLQASLEEGVPKVFYDQEGQEVSDGVLLDLDAHRDGPIRLRASKGALVAEVPVAVFAKVYSERKAEQRAERGRDEPAGTRVEGHLVVRAAMSYVLDDDWTLRSTTRLSHSWVSKPTLSLGPFRFGIEKLADKALAPRWPEIAQDIDARNAADTKLREAVERVWTELGTARQVQAEPPTWWVGVPEALFATSPVVDDDAIRLTVGLQGRFAIVVGDPGSQVPLPPLPPRADPPDSGAFRVAVATRLDWTTLSGLAATALEGTTWSGGGGTATIRGVELYPSGERVVVALAYDAAHVWRTDGTLYVSGLPVLDTEARELRFEDVAVGVESWDDATATAGNLAGRTLVEVLHERLCYPLGDDLDAGRAQLERGLASTSERGDVLSGTVETLALSGVRLTDEAVVVDALATGTLALRLAPMPAR